MKYNKLLNSIKSNDLYYIDYKYLKKNIMDISFVEILHKNIEYFDNYYQSLINKDNKINYEYLIINYLTIYKILKKYNKKNNLNISINLDKYNFYNDLINPCYIDNNICNLCYDKGFLVKTNCNHEFCFKCLLKCSNYFNNCPYCRKETVLDPVLIYINRIIINKDNKYSPFNNKCLNIDLISDLHIDQWSSEYNIKYPYGEIKNKPFNIKNKSEILIIAGDISDNLDLSIKYLNDISKKYKKILFVDGNHEHVNVYPNLYELDEIYNKIKSLNNNKIVYLPKNDYLIDQNIFIGYCGWWDYNNSNNEDLENSKKYFNKWIPDFNENENIIFRENVLNRAELEYESIKNKINKYENDNKIKNIILVTHSVGHKSFKVHNKATDFNTMFNNIKSNKLTYWLFGHTHYKIHNKINNTEFICNPRGRPDDFNRENYEIQTITINN